MQFVIFLCCAFFPANEQHTKSFAVAFLNSTLSVCSCTYIFYTQKQFSWYTLSGRIDDDDCVPLTHSFSFQCVSLSHTRWIKLMRCCLLAHSSYMHNVKNQFLVALSLSLSHLLSDYRPSQQKATKHRMMTRVDCLLTGVIINSDQ